MKFVLFTLVSLLSVHLYAYDLGGPCDPKAEPKGLYQDITAAEKTKNYAKLIELKKLNVRGMCENDYRWLDLAETLFLAGKKSEAQQVIDIVVKRDLDAVERENTFKLIQAYLKSADFAGTDGGKLVAQARAESDARKKEFRSRLAGMKQPGNRYIAMGACPFECCTYRAWTVERNVSLVDGPLGRKTVLSLKKGERVTGVTGQVYVKPVPVAVIHNWGNLKKGEIIFLLDYIGENLFHYWKDGKVAGDEVEAPRERCLVPGETCALEYLEKPQKDGHDWWVRIKTQDGKSGWTNKTTSFGNMDACG